jgi:uncharacterized protein (TIGR02594 family)
MSASASSAPDWLHIAYEEYLWWKANSAWDKRVRKYRFDTGLWGDDWCSIFVNWVMRVLGYSGTQSAAAFSWLTWGVSEPFPPRRGAIAILSDGRMDVPGWEDVPWHHVTFVWESISQNQIRGLGGNQTDRVQVSTYMDEVEIAYRWPPYELHRQHKLGTAGASVSKLGTAGASVGGALKE